jgi:capsular polysaccharide transport system permease protein
VLRLIGVQFRVIHALTLREFQSQQVTLAYGLGWVFFDAVLAFAGMLVMKMAIRGWTPALPGVPPITFLVSGLVPWLMFSSSYSIPAAAIKKGKNLLLLPVVTELDLIFAASLRNFVVYTILFIVLATCAAYYDRIAFPRFPLAIMLLFITMAVMGTAFGVMLMLLTRLYAPAGKFTGFFLRFGMIFSGVIFSITMFPATIWPYLTWNPLLHVEELLRTYWFYSYHTPVGSSAFVAECLFGMTFFGLLLERYARLRMPPP